MSWLKNDRWATLMTRQFSSYGSPKLVRIFVCTLQGRGGVIKFLQLSRNPLVLDSSWELWSKREDGADDPLVVLCDEIGRNYGICV